MNVEIHLQLKMLSGKHPKILGSSGTDPKNTANAGKTYLDRNWNYLWNYD